MANRATVRVVRRWFWPDEYVITGACGFWLTLRRKFLDPKNWIVVICPEVVQRLNAVGAEEIAARIAEIMQVKHETAYELMIQTIGGRKPWQSHK